MKGVTADDRWARTAAFALAAVLLGQAVEVSDGFFHTGALVLLGLGLVAGVAGVAGIVPARLVSSEKPALAILGAGLAVQFVELLAFGLRDFRPLPAVEAKWFLRAIAAAAAIAVLGFARAAWPRRTTLGLLVTCHLAAGAWVIAQVPHPGIDVFMMQQLASQDLLSLANPYTSVYPDIYPPHVGFYAPGMSEGGRLTVGFAYPPLSLLLVAPAYALGGDVRYAHLLAMVLTAAALAYAHPGLLGALAATVFLFMPRVFFVLRESWTEPLVILLFVLTAVSAHREPKVFPWMLGLLLAVKPYAVFVVPFVWLLTPDWRAYWRVVWRATLVAVVVTVPLAAGDPGAFWESTVGVQFRLPPRLDSLSYWTAWARGTGSSPPTWMGFVVAVAAGAVAIGRAPRTPAGFAGAVALTLTAFFSFATRAFCNYYFFVIGAFCCAVATSGPSTDPESQG